MKRNFLSKHLYLALILLCITGLALSLVTGKYPLSLDGILNGDQFEIAVFVNFRLARTIMAFLAGFCLSVGGYVYQTLFKNPIASPDIIGVSSGASVGAAISIVVIGGGFITTATSAFLGGIAAVMLTLSITNMSRHEQMSTFVISGIAVNALASAALMFLKLVADPLGELSRLEFWTMGSFSSVTLEKLLIVMPILVVCLVLTFKLFRQITMLSLDSGEAKMLGISVKSMRNAVLILVTLIVASVVSITGSISFIGLIAPHMVRLAKGRHDIKVMFFSGILGAVILLFADCLARSIGQSEVPISILTSLIGAPLLVVMVMKGGERY